MIAGVSGFDDREQLNMILLNRCVIQYEPFLYKGHLHDFPTDHGVREEDR